MKKVRQRLDNINRYKKMSYIISMKSIIILSSILLLTSCSFFGIQNEESPKYRIISKDGDFEIRRYTPYIIAKVKVKGNFKESSSKAFRILAGYIFGKNKGDTKIPMTSPVEIESKAIKIEMTSPVIITQSDDNYTMSFSMPSKYSLDELPKPLDERIEFKQIKPRLIASHKYSWLSSKARNDIKAKELTTWLKENKKYRIESNYIYAGYNPPWTIPFFRRNEIHINIVEK
jgi:hypothetical protein